MELLSLNNVMKSKCSFLSFLVGAYILAITKWFCTIFNFRMIRRPSVSMYLSLIWYSVFFLIRIAAPLLLLVPCEQIMFPSHSFFHLVSFYFVLWDSCKREIQLSFFSFSKIALPLTIWLRQFTLKDASLKVSLMGMQER